MMQQNEASMQR